MHCRYCGFSNNANDHRCARCRQRIGIAIAAPPGFSGANALAPSFEANETQDFLPLPDSAPQQSTLFHSQAGPKVIPFRQTPARSAAQAKTTRSRNQPRTPSEQGSLDFLATPPPHKLLKTENPAQIYCNRPVATPTHRFVAGAMDAAMVLMGFGLFMGITELAGAPLGTGKLFWSLLGLSFLLIATFYGLIFALMGRETAGMYWTDLQLITFDGFPVDGRSRAARLASTWLSFCSGGLGILWALADEETLTWQDHISKTFPTIRQT